jgi:hypothetical protein
MKKIIYLNKKAADVSQIKLKRRKKKGLPEKLTPSLKEINLIMKKTDFVDPSNLEYFQLFYPI